MAFKSHFLFPLGFLSEWKTEVRNVSATVINKKGKYLLGSQEPIVVLNM